MRTIRFALVCALLTGSLVFSGGPVGAAKRAPDVDAVVGLIDSGINPYHSTFRDDSPRALKHPSTYIPGYPKDAIALRLTLNEADYWKAVKADCERVWTKIETGQLYWFPGTKIIGSISFAPQSQINCAAPEPVAGGRILDNNGHGTMTASRATSIEYGGCEACRVVSIQMSGSGTNAQDALDSIKWAAKNNGWIDAQSNSWGPVVPAWEPTGASELMTANPEVVRTVEEVSRAHLAFWASGNGVAFRGGVLGHPTPIAPHLGPSAIIVGGHDSGYVTTWPGFPGHLSSDACASWAAEHQHATESGDSVGSGTSAATPFVAGGAVKILLAARAILGDSSTGVQKDGIVASGRNGIVKEGPLADGRFTLEEWKRTLYVSATERPEAQHEDGPTCLPPYGATPVLWNQVPAEFPEYLLIGYGAVDDPAVKLAVEILEGKTEAPDRSETDDYFDLDRQVRETTYEVWSKP